MKYTDEDIKARNIKKEKIKKCLNILTYIILIPLLIYNLIIIGQVLLYKNNNPSVFGIKTYVVLSRKYGT